MSPIAPAVPSPSTSTPKSASSTRKKRQHLRPDYLEVMKKCQLEREQKPAAAEDCEMLDKSNTNNAQESVDTSVSVVCEAEIVEYVPQEIGVETVCAIVLSSIDATFNEKEQQWLSRKQKGLNPWSVSDLLEVRGGNGWAKGVVKMVTEDEILVHYIGWPHTFDEWIHCKSPHVFPDFYKNKPKSEKPSPSTATNDLFNRATMQQWEEVVKDEKTHARQRHTNNSAIDIEVGCRVRLWYGYMWRYGTVIWEWARDELYCIWLDGDALEHAKSYYTHDFPKWNLQVVDR
ncbi:hypothetical protein RFI_16016, partial [Reticulomyxa filosa]